MNRKESFQIALSQGLLLSPQAAELAYDELMALLAQARAEGKLVAHPEAVRVILRETKPAQLTPAEYVGYYANKYTAIKAILDKKIPNSIAINKMSTGRVAAVAMVREATDQGFIAEDPTGQIEVVSKEKPEQDAVIGITGYVRAGKLWAEQLIWPDIPLTHTPSTIPGLTATIKGRHIQIGHHSITISTSPTWIKISTGQQHAHILAYQTESPQPRTWLRCRHLNPPVAEITSTHDVWLLEPIPNLIWLLTSRQFCDVYRGVTTFSPGSGTARVDLSNMTVTFDHST